MKLRAKIMDKYLDDILEGNKWLEYRQFETITLRDSRGRFIEVNIEEIKKCSVFEGDLFEKAYPDIELDNNASDLHVIVLGEIVNTNIKKVEK